MIVARGDVGGERPEGVERRLAAGGELLIHVLLDLVHRHVAGPFDHHLAVVRPGDLRQLAQGFQLGELRRIVGIGDRARAQAIAEGEAHVVRAADLADLLEMLVEEALAMVRQAPLGHDRTATRDDAGDAIDRERYVGETYAGVDGEVVNALLGLLDEGVAEHLPA